MSDDDLKFGLENDSCRDKPKFHNISNRNRFAIYNAIKLSPSSLASKLAFLSRRFFHVDEWLYARVDCEEQ